MPYQAPSNTALIIVDVQNDFCPGGKLAVSEGDQIIPLINEIKSEFPLCILTQDWHPAEHKSFASNHGGGEAFTSIEMPYGAQILWPNHCVQNSYGAAFHADLKIEDSDLVLKKGTNPDIDSYSGFYENDQKTQPRFTSGKPLTQTLKDHGITRVIFCGLTYDFCVGWHALDAHKEGFEAIVIKDACRSISMPIENSEHTTETTMDEQLAKANIKVINAADLPNILKI